MPTVAPGSMIASPLLAWSSPAMILSREDLPVPLGPTTPILAPWRNERVTLSRTTLSPWALRTLRSVKTYSAMRLSLRGAAPRWTTGGRTARPGWVGTAADGPAHVSGGLGAGLLRGVVRQDLAGRDVDPGGGRGRRVPRVSPGRLVLAPGGLGVERGADGEVVTHRRRGHHELGAGRAVVADPH